MKPAFRFSVAILLIFSSSCHHEKPQPRNGAYYCADQEWEIMWRDSLELFMLDASGQEISSLDNMKDAVAHMEAGMDPVPPALY
ncbi:MAG TPA: hypothetical protein VFU15_08825, partial [Bacteroidia bacterium]|nr:hypothetical protein [Bacteroidia bacterium]